MSQWKPDWPQGAKPRVGFIGLGIMGRPMVRNLMKAGFSLTVHNRTPSRADEFVARGAAWAASPREVAAASDVVITMVPDSPDVELVALGENSLIEGVRPGQAWIDMTTMSPEVARRMARTFAEKGVGMLDAPVSGGETGAIAGTLSIMVGGEAEVLEACRPVLEAMGTTIVHIGPSGMGQTVKLCNQIICAINLLAVAEGLSFAAKSGADLDKVLSVVTKGIGNSRLLETLGPKILAGDYSPGFKVRLQQKDLRLALEAGAALDFPLPRTALVHQLYRYVQGIGCGDEGTQALVKTFEALGQVKTARQGEEGARP